MKLGTPGWKAVFRFLTELNIPISYDPAVMFPRIYPKTWKTYVYAKAYTQMFISTLFIIVKTWKPKPRCPSVGA